MNEDLSLFEPLSNPSARLDTHYFELHPKELPYPDACWLPESLFIKDTAFDFFALCFCMASDSFHYYSFQRFGEPEIAALVRELEIFLDDIKFNPSREQLFARFKSPFARDMWFDIETEILSQSVRECGEKMLVFIQETTQESNCLWILGM
jgi:hypothetical protein